MTLPSSATVKSVPLHLRVQRAMGEMRTEFHQRGQSIEWLLERAAMLTVEADILRADLRAACDVRSR